MIPLQRSVSGCWREAVLVCVRARARRVTREGYSRVERMRRCGDGLKAMAEARACIAVGRVSVSCYARCCCSRDAPTRLDSAKKPRRIPFEGNPGSDFSYFPTISGDECPGINHHRDEKETREFRAHSIRGVELASPKSRRSLSFLFRFFTSRRGLISPNAKFSCN
jgi:hypothetical protein